MSVDEALRNTVRQAIEETRPPAGPRLLKKAAAAAYLGVSQRTIDELARAGELCKIDLGGPKFDVRELDALVQRRQSEAARR